MTSQNPYAPGAAESAPQQVSVDAGYRYRSLAFQTKAITPLLLLLCFLYTVLTFVDVSGMLMFPSYSDPEAEVGGDAEMTMVVAAAGLGILSIPIYLTVAVFVCVFMYRANGNARALGATGLTYSPGWCAGYWFVPIANLVAPYRAMKEIYLCSLAPQGESWKTGDLLSAFQPWWACWLIGNFLSRIESRLALRGIDIGQAAILLSIASTIVTVVAALLLIRIVKTIHENQQSHARRGSGDQVGSSFSRPN